MAGGKEFEALLRRQHELITREQAREHGFSDRQIHLRVARGEWTLVARGVYLVGNWEMDRATCLVAAHLWAGEDSVLSHSSAAFAHQFWGFRPPPPEAKSYASWMRRLMASPIELTVPTGTKLRPSTIRQTSARVIPIKIYRSRGLVSGERNREEQTVIPGIAAPCSSEAKTILELAEAVYERRMPRAKLVMALEHAVVRHQWEAMYELAKKLAPGRGYVDLVIDILERHGPFAPRVESAAEAVANDLFWSAELIPERQFPMTLPSGRQIRTDFFFLEENLVVEIEGFGSHNHAQHSSDRERHNGLIGLGCTVLYYPALKIFNEPKKVLAEVQATLRACRARLRRTVTPDAA